MATQFDAIPDVQFDAVPDVAFDAVPDEVVQQEAQRASIGALQALDVMGAPGRLDWSAANEQLDQQRFTEAEQAEAQAKLAEEQGSGTGPGSDAFAFRREADFQRGNISPFTAAGRQVAASEEGQLRAIEEAGDSQRQTTPSEMLSGIVGPGLSPMVMPVVEGAARQAGPAIGGAIAAARFIPHPGAQALAQFAMPLAAAAMGSQVGAYGQESLLQSTETPTETQQRQERAAEDFQRNPWSARVGGALASSPFFGPSLAQFGRAAAGDKGAILNLGIAGVMGGSMEALGAMARGETASAEDIAVGVFSNLIMNEPTRLGRRLGLVPSSEQAAVEAAGKYEGQPIPIGGNVELESGLTTRPTTSTEDVFSSVPRRTAAEPTVEAPPAETAAPGDRWYQGVGPDGSPTSWVTSNLEKAKIYAARRGEGKIKVYTPEQIGETAFEDRDGNLISAQEYAKTQSEDTTIQTMRTGGKLPDPVEILNADGTPVSEATPAVEPSEQTPTSIKNSVTAEERAARGIDLVEEPARRAFGDIWDAVKTEIATKPTAPDALLAELKQKPRALTDREDALILHKQIELQSVFDKAAEEVNQATAMGDEPVRAEAMAQLERTRQALEETYALGKQAGTETARGLAARKMMANMDFTLAAMETRLRAEQGGALTPEQQAKVKAQADTISKTQEGMDKILAEREVQKAESTADAAVDPKVKSLADRIIARLDLTAKNAATSLRGRLKNLNQLVPDPGIILDVAKIAAAKTAKGAIEFAQWSAEMVKDFGEKVRPFLQAGWDQREQHIDSEVNAIGGRQKRARSEAEKEQTAIKARLTTLANRTAEYQRRTAAGDFSPMRKPSLDLSKNPEWVKLKAENDAAKSAYEKSRYEARRAQRTTEQKVRDTVADVWGASRPILASTDISAPGRQGIFFSLPDLFLNPVRLGRQLKAMFRSQFSESKFQQNEAAIKSRENADLYEASDLYLADIDHKPSAREEQFKSELAEKIPGVGRVVRGSSRGFSAFMNTVRADAMDAFVKWSGGKEKVSPETANFLAAAINDLSGRGNVTSRQAQGALEWLAKYLFSPRLWVSRFNTALLKPVWRDPLNRAISPRARAVVLGQYAKFGGALLALKFLAGLNDGKMEEDPRDSDFGKLQFGSKRYDVMGGIGNMVTLLSRVATQKTKDDKGKSLRIAWDDEKRPERELGQILFNHLRNKAAPIPGAVYDYIYGRHPDRSKVTAESMLKQTTVPITVSDTAEFFQKDNPAAALRDTFINALGVSTQDYSK